MRRPLFSLALACLGLVASASAADVPSLLGKVQPEIRLTDGTLFTQAKIVDYSISKSTATIAEPTRIRTVPLNLLPAALRDQLLAEAGAKAADPRNRPNRTAVRPIRTPTQAGTMNSGTEPPVATTAAGLPVEQLLKLAATSAPSQLKVHLTRTYGQVGGLSTKILETGEVPGWPRIRVTGEASFTERSPGQSASSQHKEKFEIEYVIAEGVLKPETVTVGGISRPVDEK